MKKLILLFLASLMCLNVFAFETNFDYGIKEQDSAEGYQQYVGQEFMFRPAFGSLESWDKSGFKYKEELANTAFVITDIKVKDVILNDSANKEITIQAIPVGGGKKVKFKGNEEVSVKYSFWGGVKKWPRINYMPIYFTVPFKENVLSKVGTTIAHKMVKDKYEVVDVYWGEEEFTGAVYYKVKNQRTGEIKNVSANNTDAAFKKELEGGYKTALVKVEKPEDSGTRYGEMKTVADDGVEKYSYRDSIIDIIILGTNEKFNFTLKNVSRHSLKLIWNEAAFVGLDGTSSKIMHVGTKFSEREKDQPATTVIKGAKIDDVATPTANVYYDEGLKLGYSTIGNGWKTKSMLPESYKGKDVGEIRLMLPIQVKDVVNEYTFVFKVYYTYHHPELLNQEEL